MSMSRLPALPLLWLPCVIACSASDASAPVVERPKEAELGLNDVSILEPLPSSTSAPGWLQPASAGAQGELLPRAVYDAIPTFPVRTDNGLLYANMRVLGIRFDGCHKSAEGCKAQVRLVMQPVSSKGQARDSALHLFYSLSDSAFATAVSRLRAMRTLAPEQGLESALSTSPALLAQGVEGAYGEALHTLVLELCGQQNLTRMTFFLRAPPTQETWFFGGFERAEGTLTPMNIVGVGKQNQRVIRIDSASGYAFDVNPLAKTPEDGTALQSSSSAAAASVDLRSAAFASYLRVENPSLYTPDDLPCAGCHLSAYVLGESQRQFGLKGSDFPDAQFVSRFLSGASAERQSASSSQRSSLRAFGYFGTEAMVAPRTANETAAVLEDIAQRYPAKSLAL